MNLKQLEVFLAVAESRSFSKGAEATFLTQSTVSQHISALEGELGVRLFDRTSKGALLTPAGEVLLKQSRQVMGELHGIHRALARFKGVEEAELSVGASNIPGNYMIPAALPVLVSRFPGLSVTVLEGDSHDILERISRREVEVGIVGSRFEGEGFDFSPVGKDEIRLIAGINHPWSTRGEIGLEELLPEPFIMREGGSGTGKTVSDAIIRAGINPQKLKIRACLGSNEAVKHAVAAGVGVSFISEMSVRREIERGELAEVRVKELSIERQFYLASLRDRELSPAAGAFSDLMRELYPV
ncbi:MAG: LysR family transcriptional regulator [Geobacter sp.]|nr:LysR family transcriptional regulator [Geobacter sp.]